MNKYYVTMTDSFLSGWGCAEGKTNKLVIECESLEEAEIVADNAKHRTDMKRVTIVHNMPKYNEATTLVSFKTKDDMEKWFVEGWFSNRE